MADLSTNVVPKATGAAQIDNSIITDDGTTVSVGNPTTLTNLQITPRDDNTVLFELSSHGTHNGYEFAMQAGGTSLFRAARNVVLFRDQDETGQEVILLGNATEPGFTTGDATTPLFFGVPIAISVPVAIAALPGSPVAGTFATVNDATNPTIGQPVADGGAASAVVCYGGTQWTVVSK